MIRKKVSTGASGSGRLVNTGKSYFQKLAADITRFVALNRYSNVMLLTGKQMMTYGMALNLNGIFGELQKSPELQTIIHKNRENFNGNSVSCIPATAVRVTLANDLH